MAKIHLEVVNPERKVLSTEVDEVIAPGSLGLFGVRPGHTPFLTAIEAGELSYKTEGQLRCYAVGGGFVEVLNDQVTVLADTAEAQNEIDLERARRAAEDAKKRLAALTGTDPEQKIQKARAQRAAARISVATRRR